MESIESSHIPLAPILIIFILSSYLNLPTGVLIFCVPLLHASHTSLLNLFSDPLLGATNYSRTWVYSGEQEENFLTF